MKREYYDAPRTISYGATLNLIITLRSYGKTYGFTKAAVKDWVRERKQFIYCRRYESELKLAAPYIFDDIVAHDEFPDLEFKIEGNRGYVRRKASAMKKRRESGSQKPSAMENSDESDTQNEPWDIICYMIPVSKQADFKGIPFPRVRKIIWDEFVRENDAPPGYLTDDVQMFLNLMRTVAREREDVHAYLLGNACSLRCPWFAYAGIYDEPEVGYTWHRGKTVLVHYPEAYEFAMQETQTAVGKLMRGTSLANTAIYNLFADGGFDFIEPKPKAAKYRYSIVFRDHRWGVWECSGCYYVTRKTLNAGRTVALSARDMRPSVELIEQARPYVRNLLRLMGSGVLYFDTINTRETFMKMVNLCGFR